MIAVLGHTGHHVTYGFAVAGIAALLAYDWLRRRRS
jgi:hypothetical protein